MGGGYFRGTASGFVTDVSLFRVTDAVLHDLESDTKCMIPDTLVIVVGLFCNSCFRPWCPCRRTPAFSAAVVSTAVPKIYVRI